MHNHINIGYIQYLTFALLMVAIVCIYNANGLWRCFGNTESLFAESCHLL